MAPKAKCTGRIPKSTLNKANPNLPRVSLIRSFYAKPDIKPCSVILEDVKDFMEKMPNISYRALRLKMKNRDIGNRSLTCVIPKTPRRSQRNSATNPVTFNCINQLKLKPSLELRVSLKRDPSLDRLARKMMEKELKETESKLPKSSKWTASTFANVKTAKATVKVPKYLLLEHQRRVSQFCKSNVQRVPKNPTQGKNICKPSLPNHCKWNPGSKSPLCQLMRSSRFSSFQNFGGNNGSYQPSGAYRLVPDLIPICSLRPSTHLRCPSQI